MESAEDFVKHTLWPSHRDTWPRLVERREAELRAEERAKRLRDLNMRIDEINGQIGNLTKQRSAIERTLDSEDTE